MRSIATLWLVLLVCLSAPGFAQAPQQKGTKRILVLCTGNSARSQMTEGFLRSFDPSLEVYSAGTKPAARVNPFAVQAMKEVGIDISGGQPKSVSQFVGESFDYVVTVCDDADKNCPNFRGKVGRRLHIAFPDPARAEGSDQEKLAVFRRVRDDIRTRFRDLYDRELKSGRADARSMDELAKRVLAALENRDPSSLQTLAIGRPTFEQVFWPDLRLQMGLRGPADGFREHQRTSIKHMEARILELGGKRYELLRVTHGPAKDVRGFRQYRDVTGVVRDESGEERKIMLAGWVVEHGDTYRVGSYYAPVL